MSGRDAAMAGAGWRWLAPAAHMAFSANAGCPRSGWECAGRPQAPRVATRTPALHAGSVRAGRDFAVATLDRWGMRERCGDVAVVVSELLSNALRHALPAPGGHTPPWPIRFGMLQQGRWVMCAVSDPSAQPPVPGEPDYLAESGRGLHVINALSDTWGCTPPSILGKAVWAMFSVGRSPRVP